MTPRARPALAEYRKLGWRVVDQGGGLELVTGATVDALEVPRAAGMLAGQWWLYTDGAPDEVRKLPSMPSPAEAMAMIAAGDRIFFLTQAGACPWTAEDPAVTRTTDGSSPPMIRWHSNASRIPFPPGRTDDAHEVTWFCLPTRGIRLACPAVLLHLLAAAVAAVRHGPHMLTLPGNVLAIPVLGDARPVPSPPTTAFPRPVNPFGFHSGQ